MTRFMWTSDLDTGEQLIDGQHRELFRLANELDDVLESGGTDEDVIASAIWSLTDYVVQHFADEEELMAGSGFPELRGHKMQHTRLSGEALRLAADYFNGQTIAAARIAPFVASWLQQHILNDDVRIVEHLGRPRPE